MYCRECGSKAADEARFCGVCGARLRVPLETAGAPSSAPPSPLAAAVVPAAIPPKGARPRLSGGPLVALLMALGAVTVLCVAGAGLYFSGALANYGLTPTRTVSATALFSQPINDAVSEEATSESGTSADTGQSGADADEAYAVLVDHYDRLGDLSEEIGSANEGSYGGTGFAYDVFNESIGVEDVDERERLAEDCQDMLDAVVMNRTELENLTLPAEYEGQQEDLLRLYELLEGRVEAMLGAAQAAVSDPAEENWRPILSPASTDAREAFESGYPDAAPRRE